MALVKRQSNNGKVIGIALGVVVLGVTAYFLFNKFYLQPSASNAPTNGATTGQTITNFGEDLLNDSRFTTLTPHDVNISVNRSIEAGQANPFK